MLIYKITNTINGKIYIGKTTLSEHLRFKLHKNELNRKKHNNKHLQRSWDKYGSENFTFEVIEYLNISNNWSLNELEIFYIKKLKSYMLEFGYNLTYGGEGAKHNKETCLKISKILKSKNIKRTDEQKERQRKIMTGRKHTQESKDKVIKNHASKNKVMYMFQKVKK